MPVLRAVRLAPPTKSSIPAISRTAVSRSAAGVATGLGLSASQTRRTDFAATFWPRVTGGIAIMFCPSRPTRLGPGNLENTHVADASGLFNLMRNLGGAIGLALIDTVIYSRSGIHGMEVANRLRTGDLEAARSIGLPDETFAGLAVAPPNAVVQAMPRPLIEVAALTQVTNDAWATIALLTIAALIRVPSTRRTSRGTYG